eukprot:UN10292
MFKLVLEVHNEFFCKRAIKVIQLFVHNDAVFNCFFTSLISTCAYI